MPDVGRIFCTCCMCGAEGELERRGPPAPPNWRALCVYQWPVGTELGPLVLRICAHCLAELIVAHDRVAGDRMLGPAPECAACAALDRGESGFCREHSRAAIGDDAPPDLARLLDALANNAGVDVQDRRAAPPAPPAPPASASISVDVAEVAGQRVVKLVLPAGEQSVALALPPDTAEALARTLAQQARIARSPAGLILPRS